MLRNPLYRYGESVQVPSHLHFGRDMLERLLEYGQHTAVIDADTDERMTFAELAQKSVDIAVSLAHIGVRKGDVVSVCSERRTEILPTVIGSICLGAAYSPVEISYGTVPLKHRIEIAKPKVMFMSPTMYKLHRKAFASIGCIEKFVIYDEIKHGCQKQNGDGSQCGHDNQNGGDTSNDYLIQENKSNITNGKGFTKPNTSNKIEDIDILYKDFLSESVKVEDFMPTPVDGWKDWAFILFSSGTTGLPKGVPLTHLGVLMNCRSRTVERFKYSSILITPEWYLSFGINININCLWRGITCIFTDIEREYDFLKAVEEYKIKLLFLVPCLIQLLSKFSALDQYDVSSVEYILSSSSSISKELVQDLKKRLPNLREVYQTYGMTEAGSVCNNLYAPLGPRDGSVGVPLHGFIMKVVDMDTREPLGSFQRGEICFKSPTLTPGYIGLDNSPYFDCEGFYQTGDVGYYDTDGYFYVQDRIKDLIKYNDYSIAPAEAESLLSSLHEVKEAGVSSVEGAPAAAVVLQPGATISAAEVADYLHNMMTFFRLEGGVHFVPHLPRGAGDKLDRGALLVMLQHIIHNNKESAK